MSSKLTKLLICVCCKYIYQDGTEGTFTANCPQSKHHLCADCIAHLGKKCPECLRFAGKWRKIPKCPNRLKKCSHCNKQLAMRGVAICQFCTIMFGVPTEEKDKVTTLCLFL